MLTDTHPVETKPDISLEVLEHRIEQMAQEEEVMTMYEHGLGIP